MPKYLLNPFPPSSLPKHYVPPIQITAASLLEAWEIYYKNTPVQVEAALTESVQLFYPPNWDEYAHYHFYQLL